MNLSATVILYNPQEIGISRVIKNIQSWSSYCKKIYIIDNTPYKTTDTEIICNSIENSFYIYNGNKGGIAGAQNKACEQAVKDGFDWIMTMDQDSIFDSNDIKKYIQLVEEYILIDKKNVSFGPKIKNLNESVYWTKKIRLKILSPIKRKLLGKKWYPRLEPDIKYPDMIIASGNILKLNVWKQSGCFDEFLFIDEVDANMCHNIIRLGYKIVQFNTVILKQRFGSKVFSLLPKYYGNYNKDRTYRIIRNVYIESFRFPEYSKKYKKEIKKRFFDNCINTIHPILGLKIFFKARKAALMYIEQTANSNN